jgi:hypothetical protein
VDANGSVILTLDRCVRVTALATNPGLLQTMRRGRVVIILRSACPPLHFSAHGTCKDTICVRARQSLLPLSVRAVEGAVSHAEGTMTQVCLQCACPKQQSSFLTYSLFFPKQAPCPYHVQNLHISTFASKNVMLYMQFLKSSLLSSSLSPDHSERKEMITAASWFVCKSYELGSTCEGTTNPVPPQSTFPSFNSIQQSANGLIATNVKRPTNVQPSYKSVRACSFITTSSSFRLHKHTVNSS